MATIEQKGNQISRRSFLKLGALGGVTLVTGVASYYASRKFGEIGAGAATPTETVSKLTVLDSLSKDFYMKDAHSLWYKNPTSGRSVPVLVDLNSTEATFQYALEGGENTEGPEGGRETVRFVDYDHLYAFSESVLVGVSNWDHRVFTFDTQSMYWWERLGGEAVADYIDNADGSRSIMVWRKDASDRMVEVDSGYRIDSSSALIQASNLSSK
jgi:hypothetical protein